MRLNYRPFHGLVSYERSLGPVSERDFDGEEELDLHLQAVVPLVVHRNLNPEGTSVPCRLLCG